MDLETSNAMEALRHDLDQATADLKTGMAALDLSLGQRIATIESTLRREMREMRDELSRHAVILTESVRDDIRIVPDALAAVSVKIDALRG
jgi:hypothetical protein